MTRSHDLVTVLVDAENVRRSRWPNIRPGELVALVRAWADFNDCRVVVVFDGSAPGGVLGEHVVDTNVVVVGTGGESADAWLERASRSLSAAGDRHRLVTSDRALRAAAGRAAERVVGGGSFAAELEALRGD